MEKGMHCKLRHTARRASLAALSLSLLSVAQATTGVFLDQGGALFNVKAYGATGDGTTSDSSAITAAIAAAVGAGGGIVYFPAGTYRLTSTVVNSRSDIVSLVGSGMGSQLKIDTAIGLSYPSANGQFAQFHSGNLSHLKLFCTNTADTAVQMTDTVAAPALYDLDVAACNIGFEYINQNYWTERIVAINVTDDANNHLFHYAQNPGNANNSYGYGTYDGIYINKSAGQDVFYLTGGAYLYHTSITLKGNFGTSATGASIFNVQGSSGQACPGAAFNALDIAVEGGSYSVVNSANNGCSGGATGNAVVAGSGLISAAGAIAGTTSLIKLADNAPVFAGTLLTTAGSSDTLSTSAAAPASHCYAQPANATAAQMVTGTYVSGANWGTVTLAHPAVTGGSFQIWCQ